MTRVKAIYRSWGIPCTGKQVYAPRHRAEWLGKISEASVRRRAELYYQQLDALVYLHRQAKKELLAELLYMSKLSSVYHGEHGLRMLKELSRSYLTITKDLGRVMTCVTQIEIG